MSKNKSVKTFVKAWIEATIRSFGTALFVILISLSLILLIISPTVYIDSARLNQFLVLCGATVFGEIRGRYQWSVLRRYRVPNAAWWIIVTNIGWTIALVVTSHLYLFEGSFEKSYGSWGAMIGALLGLTQALWVRHYSRHWYTPIIWILLTTFTGLLTEGIWTLFTRIFFRSHFGIQLITLFLFFALPVLAVILPIALTGWILSLILKDYLD